MGTPSRRCEACLQTPPSPTAPRRPPRTGAGCLCACGAARESCPGAAGATRSPASSECAETSCTCPAPCRSRAGLCRRLLAPPCGRSCGSASAESVQNKTGRQGRERERAPVASSDGFLLGHCCYATRSTSDFNRRLSARHGWHLGYTVTSPCARRNTFTAGQTKQRGKQIKMANYLEVRLEDAHAALSLAQAPRRHAAFQEHLISSHNITSHDIVTRQNRTEQDGTRAENGGCEKGGMSASRHISKPPPTRGRQIGRKEAHHIVGATALPACSPREQYPCVGDYVKIYVACLQPLGANGGAFGASTSLGT